jgi:predicted dehydrogenase
MQTHNRREFIKGTSAAALTTFTTACATLPSSSVIGANERIGMGLIGCGGRGRGVAGTFNGTDRIEFLDVCDVFDERRAQAKEALGGKARMTGDHRDVLDNKNIDAVLIATPDHWHAQIAIDAMNAGKHVYVEKPLTYTIEEGVDIIKAARLNDRVCQVGMQQRSGEHYKEAKERFFDSGTIGKVTLARTWWHGNGAHLMKAPEGPKPTGLDWKRFIGPRPWRDWNPPQFYNFRAYLDFGGGQITDLYTHWIDVVQWFMGEERPTSAVATGGVYHYKDGRNAPDTICVLTEFPSGWMSTFEATLAPGLGGAGIEIVGTEGRISLTRSGYTFTPRERGAAPIEGKAARELTEAHVENFLDCCASGARPNGDVEVGHRSAMTSHLGNIAYIQKRRITLDPLDDRILPD